MNNDNPYAGPDQVTEPKPAINGFRGTAVKCLSGLAILAVLVALLLPARRNAREAARRSQCIKNLKQIGMAVHHHESVYGVLPPAYTVGADGRPLHSWRTLILPYLDQRPLYESIDLAKSWDAPVNVKAYKTAVETYRCVSSQAPPTQTVYLAVVTPDSCLQPKFGRKLSEIPDRGQTLMIIEAPSDQAVHWMSPNDASEQMVTGFGPKSKLNHERGTQAGLVDGSIRFLSESLSASDRRRLISISRDEKAGLVDW